MMKEKTMTLDPDLIGDVEAFHRRFGISYDGQPRLLDKELGEFRLKFMREEIDEYSKAMILASYDVTQRPQFVGRHLEEMLDALVDEVYVAIGTAVFHGFNFREAWRRVHAANMRKQRAPSAQESKRGHASDVIKPVGWEPPCHADLVANHAHLEKP
jgi:predicted HAD superfamily Cof-like phosphohydrolase